MRITKLECVKREVRASHYGTEIVRTFYVEPYEAHIQVVAALLGGIELEGDRRLPSHDPYWQGCYCTDAWVDQTAQENMSWSPSLMEQGEMVPGPGRPATHDNTVIEVRTVLNTREVPTGEPFLVYDPGPGNMSDPEVYGNAGAFVRATYKPLIFGPLPIYDYIRCDKFDFVDPQLQPLSATVNTGCALRYLVEPFQLKIPLVGGVGPFIYPSTGTNSFITQSMQTFTIRRIMCPFVPIETIACLKGKVNGNFVEIGGFPFPSQTLRFDDAQVEKRAVPGEDGQLTFWYDILYVFTWNCIWEEYYDRTKKEFDKGYVTWNRVLGSPTHPITGWPINPSGSKVFDLNGAPLSYYPVGWKSTNFGTIRPLYLADTVALVMSRLQASGGFLQLFNMDAS